MTSPAPSNFDINSFLNLLINNTPITGTGGSDDLNRAYMAALAQRDASAVQATTQLATADQANRVRWAELMGAAPGGQETDAHAKWVAELNAQQSVQDTKLRQEFAQMMGYVVDAQGNITQNPTLQGRQLQNEIEQAQANRAQQTAMEALQQQGRMALQTGQQGWQTQERVGTQGFQAGETAAERAARLQLQREQQGFQTSERTGTQQFQAGESAAERALRLQMQSAELGSTAQQNEMERQLRRDLQSGQLTQQESEFARNYIIQQEQSRQKTSELGGYMVDAQGNATGQLTEAGRAAREQERVQRAAMAAQLMQSPKDVFRAGAYFRNMGASGGGADDPYAMGLGGGGIAGFNSMAQRGAGTPGSATLQDVESMPGMGASVSSTPQEQQAAAASGPAAQAQAMTGTPAAPSTTGGVTASGAVNAPGTTAASTAGASGAGETADDEPLPGTQPGGPVGTSRRRRRGAQTPGADLASLFGQAQARSASPNLQVSDSMNRWAEMLNQRAGRPSGQPKASRRKKQATTNTGQTGGSPSPQAQIAALMGGAAPAAAAAPVAPTAPVADPLAALQAAAAAPAAPTAPVAPAAPAAASAPEAALQQLMTGQAGGAPATPGDQLAMQRQQNELMNQFQFQAGDGMNTLQRGGIQMPQPPMGQQMPQYPGTDLTNQDPYGVNGGAWSNYMASLPQTEMYRNREQMQQQQAAQQAQWDALPADQKAQFMPAPSNKMYATGGLPTNVPQGASPFGVPNSGAERPQFPGMPQDAAARWAQELTASQQAQPQRQSPQTGQDQGSQTGQDQIAQLLGGQRPDAAARSAWQAAHPADDASSMMQEFQTQGPASLGSQQASMGVQQTQSPASLGTQQTQDASGSAPSMNWGSGSGSDSGGGAGATTKQDPSSLGGSSDQGSASGGQLDTSAIPGMTPGGPVSDPLSALMAQGRPTMGAGGNFQQRAAPDGSVPGVIPYVDPSVLQDPDVQAMVRDVRNQGVRSDTLRNRSRKGSKKSGPSGPAGPQGEALLYDSDEADRRRWSDERFLQGLAGLNQRGVLGRPGKGPGSPGTQPAGPGDVAAATWPAGGAAATPTVPSAASVGGGGGSSFATGSTDDDGDQFPSDTGASGLTGMDPGNQNAAMQYMSDFLINGVGNADPQFMQKMSKTQRGTAEGALQAMGLSWDDFVQASAQTRFQNVGNVLSA